MSSFAVPCYKNVFLSVSLTFMAMGLISGCGQKGALYLPVEDRSPDKTMSQQEPVSETEASEGKAAKISNQVPNNTMY